MTNDKNQRSPGEASRDGLADLEKGHPHHETTAHTPAPHANGAKFDETASEVHRGGQVPMEKK